MKIKLTIGLIIMNMFAKFGPKFILINGYMVSDISVQRSVDRIRMVKTGG